MERYEMVAIDQYLADQYAARARAVGVLQMKDGAVHRDGGDKEIPLVVNGEVVMETSTYSRTSRPVMVWSLSFDEAFIQLGERITELNGWDADRAADTLEDVQVALLANEAANEEIAATTALYEGWSRFFLVVSSVGHIHSSMNCSTCYDTTEYGWLPELSGLDEADAVEAHGAILCTVCFPTAPVEWTNGERKINDGRCDGEIITVTVEGKWNRYGDRWQNGYGVCTCGKEVAILQNGKPRKHMALTEEEIAKAAALEIKRAKRAANEAKREAEWQAELAAMRAERESR